MNNLELIDNILDEYCDTIGEDLKGYRNHVHRMTHFCLTLGNFGEDAAKKVAIAGCFHDIGIWTGKTFDYLPPSISAAGAYLAKTKSIEWLPEVSEMIDQHHKLRQYKHSELVENFRRADLIDFSLGLFKFGIPSSDLTEIKRRFPNEGFHKMLVIRASRWICRHPLDPVPVIKF